MQYRLSPGTRLSRGGCIAHQLFVIEEDGSEYLLAEEACSAPSGRCKTFPVTLEAGVDDVKLCGEHSLAHELLQRQSEIDRGPSELEPKSERHPAGVTFDASNKPDSAPPSELEGMFVPPETAPHTSLLGSETASVDTAIKPKKKKNKSKQDAPVEPQGTPQNTWANVDLDDLLVVGNTANAPPHSATRQFNTPVSPPTAMATVFSPASGREIPLLPLAPEVQDVKDRWLRVFISDNRLRTLGYMPSEGFFLFRCLFVGMARDNPNAAVLHIDRLNRYMEIVKEDVMLSLMGSPKRTDTGIKIDGDWTELQKNPMSARASTRTCRDTIQRSHLTPSWRQVDHKVHQSRGHRASS